MENKSKVRTVITYKSYFEDFFVKQKSKVQDKIIWTFDLIEEIPRVPETYLKHLENTDGLYEIRIEYQSNFYRIFCCFDKGNLVVLFNEFQKKTPKKPNNELENALKLKNEYFENKKLGL